MTNHAADALELAQAGRPAVVVRVTGTAGLGPRATDELLLVDDGGSTVGSLLGGAADARVVPAALDVLAGAVQRARTLTIDIGDDDAESAGLTCGGVVHLIVQPLDHVPAALWEELALGHPAALATVVGGSAASVHRPGQPMVGSLGSEELDELARATAAPLLAQPGHHVHSARAGDVELLVEAWHPVPRLLVVGRSPLSDALDRQAALLGWPATVVTGRAEALSAVGSMSVDDVIVVVDHDHELATAVLAAALHQGIGYVGALGSRSTQVERRARLMDAGVDGDAMARYHGPTGLDLGSRTPAETAVSIVAEALAVRSGRPAAPLQSTAGRIGG